MLKAYKFRLYPNEEQKLYLAKTFGCTRFIYNRMLAERIKSYEKNKDLDIKQIKYPTPAQYKKEFEWLKEVMCSCWRNPYNKLLVWRNKMQSMEFCHTLL